MSLAFSECTKCKRNKIGYICSWEDKFNYNCKNFTPKENKKLAEEMLEPVDDLLEYALEKLGMTKNELQDKMDRDKEDIAFIKKCMNDKKEVRKYCHRFELGCCDSCKIWKFKNKYKNKDDDVYEYLTDVTCNDVYKYLKEKGDI